MLGDVGAGAEVVAHAAHDQQANRVIGRETLAVCGDAVPHVVGDGVALRGPIEPQRGDAVVDLDAEAGNFQRRRSSHHACLGEDLVGVLSESGRPGPHTRVASGHLDRLTGQRDGT